MPSHTKSPGREESMIHFPNLLNIETFLPQKISWDPCSVELTVGLLLLSGSLSRIVSVGNLCAGFYL